MTTPLPLEKKVFITGPNGFVGKNLIQHLLKLNYEITAGFRSNESLEKFKSEFPTVKINYIVTKDLAHPETDLAEALKNHFAVIHLAARVHQMQESAKDPELAYKEQNVTATENLVQAAKKAGVKRFIFISTIKVNGEETPPNRPFKITDEPHPTDLYSITKLEAEKKLKLLAFDSSLQFVVLRPPLIYGAEPKANLKLLLQLVKTGLPLPFKSVQNKRSLLSVFNLCEVIEKTIYHPAAPGQVFLVADNEPISLPELLQALAESVGKKAYLFNFPVKILISFLNIMGLKSFSDRLFGNLEVDISFTKKVLDWTPSYNLKNTLTLTRKP